MPQNKRRGTISRTIRPKGEESESESGEERSPEPSESPEVRSQPTSRRSSNVDKLHPDGYHPQPPPSLPPMNDRRDPYPNAVGGPSAGPPPPPPSHQAPVSHAPPFHHKVHRNSDPYPYHPQPQPRHDHDLPHITTLLPETSPPTPQPMSASNNTLAPIRPANDQQAALRKRSATLPGKTTRVSGNSGPKVVACNFCRGMVYWCTLRVATKYLFSQLARQNATARIRHARVALGVSLHAIMHMMRLGRESRRGGSRRRRPTPIRLEGRSLRHHRA